MLSASGVTCSQTITHQLIAVPPLYPIRVGAASVR